MAVRLARILSVALAIALGGCGGGDDPGIAVGGTLFVSRGGSGTVYFPASQLTLNFANSVTIAVRGVNDSATQFTLYTFFGLSDLTFRQVPSAALVTFVDGLDPASSAAIELPSTTIGMALHTGFDQTLVSGVGDLQRLIAQTAPVIYEQTVNGTFILEPQPSATSGAFTSQDSPNRRMRTSTITLTDRETGAQALIQGAVDFILSFDVSQRFLGYVGDLGLDVRPPASGGGPPAPPGSTGSGSGTGGGDTGTDTPPAPPL